MPSKVVNKKKIKFCPGIDLSKKLAPKPEKFEYPFGKFYPLWYQELSDRQMKAADQLNLDVQEDSEQATVHRCQYCLRNIGIKPIVPPDDLQKVLYLCRGNDLAFLWFLLQYFYKDRTNQDKNIEDQDYSLNERLLMTAMCHLDMVTTLKELNRILPKGPRKIKCVKEKPVVKKIPKTISPYLQPLPRPIIPVSHNTLKPRLPQPSFKPYTVYLDKHHVIQNEATRWYAFPELRSEKWFNKHALMEKVCDKNKNARKVLKDFFQKTKCSCTKGKKCESCKYNRVFPIDLELAKTPEEFSKLAKLFFFQQSSGMLYKHLIYNIESFNHVKICNKCKICKNNYDIYVEAQKYNEKALSTCCCSDEPWTMDYEHFVRNYLTGKGWTCFLTQTLDDGPKCRKVCFKYAWTHECYLWYDVREKVTTEERLAVRAMKKFNPKNKDDMRLLLRVALCDMAENPKYVLAALPGACEIPLLKEWIKVRYGHKYTAADRQKALGKSLNNWNALLMMRADDIFPRARHVSKTHRVVNYNYKEEIVRCINRVKNDYYNRLNSRLVNEARRFWPTMASHLCGKCDMRELFFAYLPSNEYETPSKHPWYKGDYRDMKEYYNK